MAVIMQHKSQTNTAVITVDGKDGSKVNAIQVTFSMQPEASASFTVQILNKDATSAHFNDIAPQVAVFMQEQFQSAREFGIPMSSALP